MTVRGRTFDRPDERNEFPNGHADVLAMGSYRLVRAVFGPGWKWTESLKEMSGTDLCEVPHIAYIASGTLHVLDQDGTEAEFGPGSVVVFDPGHDAWVVGTNPASSSISATRSSRPLEGANRERGALDRSGPERLPRSAQRPGGSERPGYGWYRSTAMRV